MTEATSLDESGGNGKGLKELKRIISALQSGRLDQRANAAAVSGEWSEALDAINSLAGTLAGLIGDLNVMSSEHDKGEIDAVIDSGKYPGDFGRMAQGINAMAAGHISVKKKAMACINEFASGNFEAALERFPGKKSFINDTIEKLRSNLQTVIADMNAMSAAHDKGEIDVEIDAGKHPGDFGRMAQGINAMVGGHISVKKKAMACVNEFANGNFDAALERFPGKKVFINDTIEKLRTNLQTVIRDMNAMSAAHDRGDIDEVIDAGKYPGDFGRMAQGINTMVVGHIAVKKKAMACVNEFANGNFEAALERFPGKKAFINDTIEKLRTNLRALVADANLLSAAAIEGKLATRAEASKHQGDFRKIVQGVNDTLDAVITPLNNIREVIEALGRNDMSASLKGDYRGDFLALKEAFERALEEVNSTLHQIVDAVEQVGQSAEQLRSASQNMASTSEEQSSSVEEVTSSLEETDSQVKANTDAANTANQLVMGTSQAANIGQTKMNAMTAAMSEINASAQNIGKIIKVIDEIAFQTNLLALNAAVEAARAGQHGRGFAVVAQEVRNLAGRSAKAARETAELIENSVKQVAGGVGIAKETSEALDQIVGNVVKVKDLVGEIATASAEQARGVSQISTAMNQVAKAAQEGSQQSEELASSSGELASLADRMRDSVRRFKLREQTRSAQTVSGLEGLSPDMLTQLKALLAAQQAQVRTVSARPVSGSRPAFSRLATNGAKSPKAILPLDQDERGFGKF